MCAGEKPTCKFPQKNPLGTNEPCPAAHPVRIPLRPGPFPWLPPPLPAQHPQRGTQNPPRALPGAGCRLGCPSRPVPGGCGEAMRGSGALLGARCPLPAGAGQGTGRAGRGRARAGSARRRAALPAPRPGAAGGERHLSSRPGKSQILVHTSPLRVNGPKFRPLPPPPPPPPPPQPCLHAASCSGAARGRAGDAACCAGDAARCATAPRRGWKESGEGEVGDRYWGGIYLRGF